MSETYQVGIVSKGYQQVTVSSSAVSLTVPKNTKRVVIYVEEQPIRWRDDGSAPTDTVGVLAKADTKIELLGSAAAKAFRAIRQGSTDSSLSVVYYG